VVNEGETSRRTRRENGLACYLCEDEALATVSWIIDRDGGARGSIIPGDGDESRGDAFRFYGRAEVSARVGRRMARVWRELLPRDADVLVYGTRKSHRRARTSGPPLVKHRAPRSPGIRHVLSTHARVQRR